MNNALTLHDLDFILESLKNTKHVFENYQDYPSHEYKQKRIQEVNDVASKIMDFKKQLKS